MARVAFSSSVFLIQGLDVLLVLHPRYNLWLPVGGELEQGETPLTAAIRETREETGLQLDRPNFLRTDGYNPPGLLCYEEHYAGDKGLHCNFNFVAKVTPSQREDVKLSDEHAGFAWYPLLVVAESPEPTTADNTRRCAGLILDRLLESVS